MTDSNAATKAPSVHFSTRYKIWLLFLLVAVYACSFLDRIVVAVLGQAIKTDLGLTDFQMGLIGGLSFALFFTISCIPLGRMAERCNRVRLISVCVVVWSIFATLCGYAQSFWQMILFRCGVGIGEAGTVPGAHALIADHFPPDRRATALGIFALGVPLGVLIASFAGGWLAQSFGWRSTFIYLGVPGVALGALTWFTLREPPRGLSDKTPVSADVPALSSVVRRMWSNRTTRNMVLGTVIGAFALQGINMFIPMYLSRVFGMSLAKAGFTFGLVIGVGGFIGISLGGIIADWLSPRDQRWYAWVPGCATLIAVPVATFAFLQDDSLLATSAIFLFATLTLCWNGPTFSTIHRMVEPRMRATSSAIMMVTMTLIGHGMGPPVIGFLSDMFASQAFTGGLYKAVCVSGAAAPAAGSELAVACLKASAVGIRNSMLCFVVVLVWAGLLYLRAAKTYREDLQQPRGTPVVTTRPVVTMAEVKT
ncbi:putative MFS-type efflux pump MSMEG_3705 [Georgfuchsia toluolica]|uniref:MFS-type efflux pump MSMEG_3705 n=1 Tax=Georgfuchsia toluolica TaxID=424218 RepID=A0A916J2P8_9PROT|nr:MFS transporter [Georgfuchsia toluolica]CAG4882294.1 putative MFS-type efflux pump MSMEG_3705 [Georgfuchsia toluolica]